MNNSKNILSFDEYSTSLLEQVVYEQELNEGSIMGGGIRGFFNKRAAKKVRAELSDEIEMSKSIMDGIKQGLETMSENFDTVQKSLDNSEETDAKKGEKQKLLENITKILENSKKSTWDLNELIDEGEIDYTGFTANVGIASVAYFGILLTPFRAAIMIHKGYKYFFAIVKNTIRKALVMLQLNFDQFSNLIVTQSMKAAGLVTAIDAAKEVDEFYGNLLGQIGSSKELSKKQIATFEKAMKGAKDKFEQQRKSIKDQSTAENLFNNLDPYNNTYTKSLEALRQYSSDDVQKHMDAIKNSMNKLAGQEADLQTFSELLLAAAEEHAYEVSTSIYNKFAKMTEVFSLPNQQKLIDLILAANKEQKAAAKKAKKERDDEIDKEKASEKESKCVEIFKSIDGVKLGDIDKDTNKYDDSEIEAEEWTYEKFSKLNKDDKDLLSDWLNGHQEVLEKCDETLQIYITSNPNSINFNSSYIDSLIDYIGSCLMPLDEVDESYNILTFDEYILEAETKSVEEDEDLDVDEILSDDDKNELDEKIEDVTDNLTEFFKSVFGKDFGKPGFKMTDKQRAKLEYMLGKCEDDDAKKDIRGKLVTFKKTYGKSGSMRKYCINLKNLNDSQISDLKDLYKISDLKDLNENEDKYVPVVALKTIGKKILNDDTFVKNSKSIVEHINKCFKLKVKRVNVSVMTCILLDDSIKKLKEMRNTDYSNVRGDSNDTEKSEK